MAKAILYVCTTCRKSPENMDFDPAGGPCPGTQMLGSIQTLDCPADVEIRGVECLSACAHGCAVALAAPGKWSYIYAGLSPLQHARDILSGAALYAQSADGMPPWRMRPEIFRKNVIARTPPLPEQET